MSSLQVFAVAALVLVAAGGQTHAVELPPVPTLPAPSEPDAETKNWYLRGDVGVGFISAEPSLAVATPRASVSRGGPPAEWAFDKGAPPPFGMIDAGVGYRFNPWLRTDGTLEYRGGGFRSRSRLVEATFGGTAEAAYADSGGVSSIVGLVNAYLDLGTYWGFTPFIGAGAGFADNRVSGVTDRGVAYPSGGPIAASAGSFAGGSKTSLAWALMAGLGFDLSPSLRLELGYRYLNYGSVAVSGWRCAEDAPGAAACLPTVVSSRGRLATNDIRLGLIWTLGEFALLR
jgi:opacity protein-like surface antigen